MRAQAENSQRSHLFGSHEFCLSIFRRLKKIALFLSMILLTNLFISLFAPTANADLLSATTTRTSLINPSVGIG